MTNLQLFFAAQHLAHERGQLRLRATLTSRDSLPIIDRTEYELLVFVGGMQTWQRIKTVEGKSNRQWVAEEMMGGVLLDVLLTGFRDNAERTVRLNEDCGVVPVPLSGEPLPGELLPNG